MRITTGRILKSEPQRGSAGSVLRQRDLVITADQPVLKVEPGIMVKLLHHPGICVSSIWLNIRAGLGEIRPLVITNNERSITPILALPDSPQFSLIRKLDFGNFTYP